MDELEFYNGALTGQEIDYRFIRVSCGPISSLPYTYENAKITAKHVVVDFLFSNPAAHVYEWTISTANGSLTISGNFQPSVDTSLTLGLAITG